MALTLQGHAAAVLGVAWSPDGTRLATAADDVTVKVWDAKTGQVALTLKGHTNAVWGVAWSPDGTRLASASADYTVRLWPGRALAPAGLGLAHLILRTVAAQRLAAAGPPLGAPAQDVAALALMESDAFLLAASQERAAPSKPAQP